MSEARISSRKTRVGKVVSDKMDKTVVVGSLEYQPGRQNLYRHQELLH